MWTGKTKEIPVIIGRLKPCQNFSGETYALCHIELEIVSKIQSNSTPLMIFIKFYSYLFSFNNMFRL